MAIKVFERFFQCFIISSYLLIPLQLSAEVLSIGSISTSPSKEIKTFLPLANYLQKQLQSQGVEKVSVVVATDIFEMVSFFEEKKVDIYIDSVFPVIAVNKATGSKVILRRWKKGVAEYKSVIFTRKDSGITTVAELKGNIIAFEDSFSSGGYFLPKLLLENAGLKLTEKRTTKQSIAKDEIGYVFSADDVNTMTWVLRKKVQAGAMSLATFKKEARAAIKDLVVIDQSFVVPRHIVSVRGDLSSERVSQLKKILLDMTESEEGRKALLDFQKTTKFDAIPDGALKPILEQHEFINREMGLL